MSNAQTQILPAITYEQAARLLSLGEAEEELTQCGELHVWQARLMVDYFIRSTKKQLH